MSKKLRHLSFVGASLCVCVMAGMSLSPATFAQEAAKPAVKKEVKGEAKADKSKGEAAKAVPIVPAEARSDVAAELKINGRVTDADGKPMTGIKLTQSRGILNDGRITSRLMATTDKSGEFEIELKGYAASLNRPMILVARNEDGSLCGFHVVTKDNAHSNHTIIMHATKPVIGRVESVSGADIPPSSVYINARIGELDCRVMMLWGADPENLDFTLPPGDYSLSLHLGLEHAMTGKDFTVTNDGCDLGKILAELSTIGAHMGKQAPEIDVTDARQFGSEDKPGMKLADYKGKWVLVDFWHYG